MDANASAKPITSQSSTMKRFLATESKMVFKSDENQKEGRRGAQFPWKLHELLEQVEKDGMAQIVSWLPGGKAFKVHKKEEFCSKIMPHYFASNKYKTWQRSLNLWGFESVVRGPDKGACHHRAFVRGHPDLCKNMTRVKIKGSLPETSEASKSMSVSRISPGSAVASVSLDPVKQALNQPESGITSPVGTAGKPAISDFLRSKANSRRTDPMLESEIMRRMSAQMAMANPLSMLTPQQRMFGSCHPFQPTGGVNNWLAAQLAAGQLGASLGVASFVPSNQGNRLISAINTAAAALDVIRQEEAEILRRQLRQGRP